MSRRFRALPGLKTLLLIVFLMVATIVVVGCDELDPGTTASSSTAGGSQAVAPAGAPSPVYVTFFSHNEDSWEPFVRDLKRYREYREDLLAKLRLLRDYGATLDWQSDITVLQTMLEYEQGKILESTEGKNIVRYMVEDLGFSVDAHGHLEECSYADLAHLIEQLGAPDSGVIGGVRLFEFGGDHLGFLSVLDWRQQVELGPDGVIHGRLYPEATWTPTILSLPAIGGHWYDEFSSGVWRPGQGTDFFTDDPDGSIVYVAQGYPHYRENLGGSQASGAGCMQEDGAYIKELVAKIESGELPSWQMYTASVHIRDCPQVDDSGTAVITLEGLRDTLEDLKPLADAGKILYVTYPEAVDIWRTQYGAVANRVPFEGFSMSQAVLERAMERAGHEAGDSATSTTLADDLTAGITDATGEVSGRASADATPYDDDTLALGTRVPCTACGTQGVAVVLHFPASANGARYDDTGSPIVVVVVPGGLDNKVSAGDADSQYFATGLGLTEVYFNLPDSGTAPYDTGGEYDQRGPACQEALREVLLFALGKKPDYAGRYITDLIPYADTGNVGVVGLSNGGNLAAVTMDRYGSEFDGLRYYVSYENPAGDEYVVTDLGSPTGMNPAYQRGDTRLDDILGSVSTLDPTDLRVAVTPHAVYFDLNGNATLDKGTGGATGDYLCNYWESGGRFYYSTEIVSLLASRGLVSFPHAKIADPSATDAFWEERDMSRHTASAVAKIGSLEGAIMVATAEDHVQNVPGHPHVVVNYWGWSDLKFVRVNPDAAYVMATAPTPRAGSGASGTMPPGTVHSVGGPADAAKLAPPDTAANIEVDFENIDSMVEPEGADAAYTLAAIVELADRVHFDVWQPNLGSVLR